MTNEEKLKRLLQVAVENGWENHIDLDPCFLNLSNISQLKIIVWSNYGDINYSLNDLITNWEEGEISFIDSLCRAVSLTNINAIMILETLNVKIAAERMRSKWCNIPTSQRLDWLFGTFKHLL
jgi:hypothetical protein